MSDVRRLMRKLVQKHALGLAGRLRKRGKQPEGVCSPRANTPNIGSFCPFFGDGLKGLSEEEGFNLSVCIPSCVSNDCDFYINVEGGNNVIPDRTRFRPVVSLVMDFAAQCP